MPDDRKTTAAPIGDLLDELASAALSVLHHDADPEEAQIERERLIEKFRPIVTRHLRKRRAGK